MGSFSSCAGLPPEAGAIDRQDDRFAGAIRQIGDQGFDGVQVNVVDGDNAVPGFEAGRGERADRRLP